MEAPAEPPAQKGDLVFDANFESGNLGQVTRVNEFEYELCIRPDTNNPKYRLWFYFGVRNVRQKQRVLLHIVNFSKTKSLYREGMSPLVRSSSRPAWQRVPERNVFYYRCPKHKKNYVLSFLFEFDREDDSYFFAYSFPYTYTDLQRYLYGLDQRKLPFYSRDLLCRTIQHRRMDVLTITSPSPTKKKKKYVFITARVHPGETPAQYICQGIIDLLVSDHPTAVALREHIVFKIVPMLNPDGVFLGNYRCSYMGYDLNRHWIDPDQWSQPEILATKEMLLKYHQDPDIDMDFVIDIHAHSVATNGFMYCNAPAVQDGSDPALAERESVYPRLLDTNSPDFSFHQTRFDNDPSKEGTGRRALGEMLAPNVHCYTLEVSFFASTETERGTNVPYTQESYMELGRNVALTFKDYYRLKV